MLVFCFNCAEENTDSGPGPESQEKETTDTEPEFQCEAKNPCGATEEEREAEEDPEESTGLSHVD